MNVPILFIMLYIYTFLINCNISLDERANLMDEMKHAFTFKISV